ncbi:Swt1p [Sugiyamaella lignohabitans]|uniref:Swt1p n=1 Tax=Sugiyamaella lignohabitans TaxID=796027 RepID=A0A167D1L9_9ASCO|nr:Swt1p [Sugiyamaella lignohabitans]ANB12370.1 Swt1p [Sugiyamaella lignohabitans]
MYSPVSAIVVDTNFLMSNLDIVEKLCELAVTYSHAIVVPYQVLQELDGLKSSFDSSKSFKARSGANWLYEKLANSTPCVVGQGIDDTLTSGLDGDDAILDCCRYYHQMHNVFTVLLSNDRILCTKALVNNIRTVTFVPGMTATQIAQIVNSSANGGDTYIPDTDAMVDIAMKEDESSLKDGLDEAISRAPLEASSLGSKSRKSPPLRKNGKKRKMTLEELNESVGLDKNINHQLEDLEIGRSQKRKTSQNGSLPLTSHTTDLSAIEEHSKIKSSGELGSPDSSRKKLVAKSITGRSSFRLTSRHAPDQKESLPQLHTTLPDIASNGRPKLDKIEEYLCKQIADCIDRLMTKNYKPEELSYLQYSKPTGRDGFRALAEIIDNFRVSVFGPIIPWSLRSKITPRMMEKRITTNKELVQLIKSWGQVWLALSDGVFDKKSVEKSIDDLLRAISV